MCYTCYFFNLEILLHTFGQNRTLIRIANLVSWNVTPLSGVGQLMVNVKTSNNCHSGQNVKKTLLLLYLTILPLFLRQTTFCRIILCFYLAIRAFSIRENYAKWKPCMRNLPRIVNRKVSKKQQNRKQIP